MEEHFASIGPVQTCFIVRKSKDSKITDHDDSTQDRTPASYYGFVNYQNGADASKALETLASAKFSGRLLKIEYAVKRDGTTNKSGFHFRALIDPTSLIVVKKAIDLDSLKQKQLELKDIVKVIHPQSRETTGPPACTSK